MSLYTVKYAPTKGSEVIGQEKSVDSLRNFITNYKQMSNKVALVHGALGTGKTSAVYALAKELDLDLLEINSSDLRNKDAMGSFLKAALGQQSLFFKQKIILIDELDNLSGRKDRGGAQELAKAIESAAFPVICTANDIENKKLKAVKKKALCIEFAKANYKEIATFLAEICKKENVPFEEKALTSLARQVDGDIRAALLDLETLAAQEMVTFDDVMNLSDRKRTDTILQALNVVFKSSSAQNALRAFDNVDTDPGKIMLWLDQNLPHEYTSPKSLAKAYEHLARAEIFNSRIMRRQHWRFLVYVYNLLSAGISTAKLERNPEFINYKQPSRLLRIWQAKMKLAKRKEVVIKYAKATHVSTKVATQNVHYLQRIFKHNPEQAQAIAHDLELSDEEVAWLRK